MVVGWFAVIFWGLASRREHPSFAVVAEIDLTGWVVVAAAPRMGGGKPFLAIYDAGFADAADAIRAVKKATNADTETEIVAVSPLSAGALKALGIAPGEIRNR